MKNIKILVASIIIFSGVSDAFGFVLLGPADLDTTRTLTIGQPPSTVWHNITGVGTNDMGGPKELKTFFRVNTPYWTYGFDMSFVRFFGVEGMQAVHDAFHVLNDFFVPRDGSYVGVSSIDFARDGYKSNYNTGWINATAENLQILDMKSLMLGMLLNQIGVGNPHRYAFSIRGSAITAGIIERLPLPAVQWNFNVVLRNYDPETWQPTDMINGVTYSYRLIHDANGTGGLGTPIPLPQVVDMEEFTTDTSGNAWTAVSSITDAFYWNTALFWTGWPTTYDFGVYYDGANSMGGQYQPRHALTYDDVGALKYLYRTNNFVYEDTNGTLIKPAQYLKSPDAQNFDNPDNWFPAFGAGNPSMRGAHPFPRRGGGNIQTPRYMSTSPFRNPNPAGVAFLAGIPVLGGGPGPPVAIMDIALRGGIDKLQFYPVEYDSLMHTVFAPTNFIWTDVFVTNDHFNVLGRSNTTAGASVLFGGAPDPVYASQVLGRTVMVPDIIIVAQDLGRDPVFNSPIAWNRTAAVIGNAPANGWVSYHNSNWESRHVTQPANVYGPGVIDLNGTIYRFGKMNEGFEMLWSGEASMVGNQVPYSLWGHIKGPGPGDLVIFPHASDQPGDMILQMENEVTPRLGVPVISKVSDDGGTSAIAPTSYTRTKETLTIIGSGLAGVTAIEIVSGDLVVQTLFPVKKYLVTDQRIDIPPGVLNFQAEGTARQVQVWNTVGVSEKSKETFNIYTGPVVLTRTSRDQQVFDRAQPLLVYGYGFKSSNVGPTDGGIKLASFRVEDVNGTVLIPAVGGDPTTAASWEVLSDTKALLPINSMNSAADGSFRRLRVSRDLAGLSMSATNNVFLIDYITSSPVITGLNRVTAVTGALTPIINTAGNELQRDTAIRIDGTALNTASAVEIVNVDGSSFVPPVVVNLPNAGVIVDANGTSIQISLNTFAGMPGADGHAASQRRKLKVSNSIGSVLSTVSFNVNVQPVFTGFSGLQAAPAPGGAFNRSPAGDDVTIVGSGLLAVSSVEIVNPAGGTFLVSIPLPSSGVTVTDTSIVIDTSAQQFGNGASADSTLVTGDRRFQLLSVRNPVNSDGTLMFIVGGAPTYTSLTGSGGFATPFQNYERDEAGTLIFTGTSLGLMTGLEYTDGGATPIATVTPLTSTTGVSIDSATQLTVTMATAATTLATFGHLLDDMKTDSLGDGSRRIRVTTPFGSVTSDAVDGFTISALPTFGTTDVTFAGGGYAAGTVTYTLATGDLFINAALNEFNAVKTITFEDTGSTVYHAVSVDPDSPPAGITWPSGAGDQIVISAAYLTANALEWANGANRRVRLSVPGVSGDRTALTGAITTANATAAFITFNANANSYFYPNYKRGGTAAVPLVVNRAGTAANFVAPMTATLVDALGGAIAGITPVTFNVTGVNAGNVAADAFNSDGKESDSTTENRRLKLIYPGGTSVTSSQLFTVSSTLGLSGSEDTVYRAVGAIDSEGFVNGTSTYSYAAGNGDISINVTSGEDMNGVTTIEFWNTGGSVAIGSPLTPADWTVSAGNSAGSLADTITISKATMLTKGYDWYKDSSPARAFKITIASDAAGTGQVTAIITAAP